MTDGRIFSLVWAIGCMVLVISGLLARRLPTGRMALLALVWAGIFAMGYAAFRLFV